MKLNNKYYILRHGEALSNLKNIISCWPEKDVFPLTEKGRNQIKLVSKKLKNKNIDLIFSSDLLRTKQTAEIISKELKLAVKYDKRLREHNVGVFNGEPIGKLRAFFPPKGKKRFDVKIPKGETYADIQKRTIGFLKDAEKKYKNKTILIISHEMALALFEAKFQGISNENFYKREIQKRRLKTGQFRELNPQSIL